MMMVWTYTAYLAVSGLVTVCVARSLYRGGHLFLVEVFGGNERTAEAVNRLLVAGFYLVNLAFVTLTLRSGEKVVTLEQSVELLGTKLGTVLLTLGVMHFINLLVFSCIRRAGWARRWLVHGR